MNTDVIIGIVGTGAALVVAQWPWFASLLKRVPLPAPVQPTAAVTYLRAVESLVIVRERLAASGGVDAESQTAIEVLTLALVKGSDK